MSKSPDCTAMALQTPGRGVLLLTAPCLVQPASRHVPFIMLLHQRSGTSVLQWPCAALWQQFLKESVHGQRARVACRAKGDAEAPALGLDALAPLTRTPLYRWGLQGAVVLVILGAIDAGWSGDWHRLGVLTTDQEAAIRGLLALLGFFHIGAGPEPLVLWQMGETSCHTASAL